MLTVGSLFSGIGGLDLGLERAGMRVIWQSEIDPYACKVLSKHWPEVANHGNIKEINWQEVEKPDVICGGYPCQPFSTAGKRRGEEDPRHLWPWVREAISELRPRYAILENVRGHLSMGGLSVIGELASIGYDAEWRVVSAASVGANHRRDRIIIVAYPNNAGNGTPRRSADGYGQAVEQGRQIVSQSWSCGCSSTMADTNNSGCSSRTSQKKSQSNRLCLDESQQGRTTANDTRVSGCSCNVADTNDGRCQQCQPEAESLQGFSCSCKRTIRDIPRWWQTEPDVGRVAHGIPSRVDRLRGLGNAVVPQVAEVIGRLVVAHAQGR